MEIEFLTLKNKTTKFKATVHATGKLNFSPECKQIENFENIKFFKVGTGTNTKRELYLVSADENDENTLKVSKSGKSLYLNFGEVLEELKIDYKKNNIVFEILKNENKFHGKDVFTLKKIETKKRDKKEVKNSVTS